MVGDDDNVGFEEMWESNNGEDKKQAEREANLQLVAIENQQN